MEFTEFMDFILKLGIDVGILIGIVAFSEIVKRTVKFIQNSKIVYFLPIIFAAAVTWSMVSPFTFTSYFNMTFKYAGIAMLIYNLGKYSNFYKKIFPDKPTEEGTPKVESVGETK